MDSPHYPPTKLDIEQGLATPEGKKIKLHVLGGETMLSKKEKKRIVQNMINFLSSREYNPSEFSKYTYLISLDEKIHRSDDIQLNEIMYTLSGMDAGEENGN